MIQNESKTFVQCWLKYFFHSFNFDYFVIFELHCLYFQIGFFYFQMQLNLNFINYLVSRPNLGIQDLEDGKNKKISTYSPHEATNKQHHLNSYPKFTLKYIVSNIFLIGPGKDCFFYATLFFNQYYITIQVLGIQLF